MIARVKGFRPWRWSFALGIIGFITVLCMRSANERGISLEEAEARAIRANSIGANMCWINAAISVFALLIGLAMAVSSGQ